MYIKRGEIKPFVSEYGGGRMEVREYGGLSGGMDIGVAEIRGEYPGGGKWARNREVDTMTYFVLFGAGRVEFDGGATYDLTTSDCLFIPRGQGYRVTVAKGEVLEVLMASNPAWRVDQYEVY